MRTLTHAPWLLGLGLLTLHASVGFAQASEVATDGTEPAKAAESPQASTEPSAAILQATSRADGEANRHTAGDDAAFAQVEGELSSILDELIQARTRAAVLTKTLFRTPLEVRVIRRADAQRLSHITLRLDGVPVHDSDGATLTAAGDAVLFEGFAAPGLHELSLEVTEESSENTAYRYVRSERFRLEVKKDTKTQVELTLKDASNMAEKLPRKNKGVYDVRTVLRVRAEKVDQD